MKQDKRAKIMGDIYNLTDDLFDVLQQYKAGSVIIYNGCNTVSDFNLVTSLPVKEKLNALPENEEDVVKLLLACAFELGVEQGVIKSHLPDFFLKKVKSRLGNDDVGELVFTHLESIAEQASKIEELR